MSDTTDNPSVGIALRVLFGFLFAGMSICIPAEVPIGDRLLPVGVLVDTARDFPLATGRVSPRASYKTSFGPASALESRHCCNVRVVRGNSAG